MTITSRGALRLALLEVEATLDVGASDESVRRKIDALLIEIERWATSCAKSADERAASKR